MQVTFSGCAGRSKTKCQTSGSPEGVIVSSLVGGRIGYLKAVKRTVGVELSPLDGSSPDFADFECAGVPERLSGSVVARVKTVGKPSSVIELQLKGKRGTQAATNLEGDTASPVAHQWAAWRPQDRSRFAQRQASWPRASLRGDRSKRRGARSPLALDSETVGDRWGVRARASARGTPDQPGVSPNARRSSPSVSPSTRTTFSRERSPRITLTRPRAMPARLAISLHSAAFAWPSTGAAATLTCSTPSRSATSVLRFARGCSRTARSASGIRCSMRPDSRDER